MITTGFLIIEVVVQSATWLSIIILSYLTPDLIVGKGVRIGVNGLSVLDHYFSFYDFTDEVCNVKWFVDTYGLCDDGEYDQHDAVSLQVSFHFLILIYMVRIFIDAQNAYFGHTGSWVDTSFRTVCIAISFVTAVVILFRIYNWSILKAIYFPTSTKTIEKLPHSVSEPLSIGYATINMIICVCIMFIELILTLVYGFYNVRKNDNDLL